MEGAFIMLLSVLGKAFVGAAVGATTVAICAFFLKIGNKKRDKGKYIEGKLKPYLNATKKLLENYQSQSYYNDIISYVINYLYEMKYSEKKYYINYYGIITDANTHKTKYPKYYEEMKNASVEAYATWSLLIVHNYISKKHNENLKPLEEFINNKLEQINVNYPASFNVLK